MTSIETGRVAVMNDIATALQSLARQEQFLDVVDRDTATARFHGHLDLRPLGVEAVPLSQALGRVLARAVVADVDVPGFDRSSVDGFAVRSDDIARVTAVERRKRLSRGRNRTAEFGPDPAD